ncbi:transmembrane protein 25 isoform 3-T3 [Discoglossus pictus]
MLLHLSLLFLHPSLQTGLGVPLQNDETQGVFCEGSSPSLTWYLNGVKQEGMLGKEPPYLVPVAPGSSSVLTLRESGENCSETPQRGEELLRVHFPPDSPVRSSRTPGMSLLLFLVVRTHPPSSFTLRDQDGQLTLNSSRLLLLDTRNVGGNGSLKVRVSTEESGVSQTSVTALDAERNQLILSPSNNMKLNNSCLPREHMSLPSNLQLNDLRPQGRGQSDVSAGETQEEVSMRCGTLANTGFDRFPLVGYIYKATSVSSDEIWL